MRLLSSTHSTIMFRPALLATVALLLAGAESSTAATNCNSGIVFSSNTILLADYEQTVATATPCITLTNGADLDLNGHKLTCKGGYVGACNVAINAIAAANSIVKNSSPGSIAINSDANSAWGTGVNNAQEVDNLRMDQVFDGISSIYATKIDGNVLTNVDTCIEATLPNNTSLISNNLCSPTLRDKLDLAYGNRTGILATGTTSGAGAKVQNNMIVKEDVGIAGSNRLRIDNNISCNEYNNSPWVGIYIDSAALQTGSNNLCCNAPINYATSGCTLPEAVSGGFHLWP